MLQFAVDLALVFCKKCKHFLLRHTSGDRFCGANRPIMVWVRAPKGMEAVRPHVVMLHANPRTVDSGFPVDAGPAVLGPGFMER